MEMTIISVFYIYACIAQTINVAQRLESPRRKRESYPREVGLRYCCSRAIKMNFTITLTFSSKEAFTTPYNHSSQKKISSRNRPSHMQETLFNLLRVPAAKCQGR